MSERQRQEGTEKAEESGKKGLEVKRREEEGEGVHTSAVVQELALTTLFAEVPRGAATQTKFLLLLVILYLCSSV